MLFLAGEVVADYSVFLNSEYEPARLWITEYANDTSAYMPSKRVLGEGGYEADCSMVYYGHPTRLRRSFLMAFESHVQGGSFA